MSTSSNPLEGESAGESLGVALEDIEQTMPRFAAWMYSVARPYLGHRVLDAGAGLGTYTELMLRDGRDVVALEYGTSFTASLMERFAARGVDVRQSDLGDPGGLPEFAPVQSVLFLNVLEHVENDAQALRNIRERVESGGTMALLVPSYAWLFNSMDTAVGHFRRYERQGLRELLTANGWKVKRILRFNAAGVPGWWASGLLKRDRPGRVLTTLYDGLVPTFAFVEKHLVRGLCGLSLVAICERAE